MTAWDEQASRCSKVGDPPRPRAVREQLLQSVETAPLSRRAVLGGLAASCLAPADVFAAPSSPRIVSLDYALSQTLIVLGHPPIATADASSWNKWVVEPPLPAETIDIGTGMDPNMELVAALKPDLILTTDYVGLTEGRLERIAPVRRLTIYGEGGSPLPKAIAATRAIGELLGRQADAERYIAETGALFDVCRRRLASTEKRRVLLAAFMDPRHVRVYGHPGLYQDVLDRIGLENAWAEPVTYWGFTTVGLERLATLGEATVVVDYLPPDVAATLATSPLWTRLPFAREGHLVEMPPVLMFGALPAARRFAELITDIMEAQAA